MISFLSTFWRSLRQQDLIDLLIKDYEAMQLKLLTIEEDLEKAKEKINSEKEKSQEIKEKETINDAYHTTSYHYVNRENKYSFDIKSFITPRNSVLEQVIKKNNLLGETHDDTAYNVMRFVQKKISYVTDFRDNGFNEHWKFPEETLFDKKGDCEDHSILILSLLLTAGVPAYKLRIGMGFVLHQSGEEVYHAYPLFLRADNQWVTLDTTWYPDTQKLEKKIVMKHNPRYKNPDRTFNNEFVWNQRNFDKP